jgi:hypothetical protein
MSREYRVTVYKNSNPTESIHIEAAIYNKTNGLRCRYIC